MEIKSFEQFQNTINENKVTVADFFATWCGPCKMLGPIFEQIGNEMSSEANFLKVDIDQFNEIASMFQVQSVPTLIFFKDGKEVSRHIGFIDSDNLKEKINSLK